MSSERIHPMKSDLEIEQVVKNFKFETSEGLDARILRDATDALKGSGCPAVTIGQYLACERLPILALTVGCLILFFPTIRVLISYCAGDEDFSYCLLIPFLSGAILFANRKSIASLPAGTSWAGLSLAAVSFGLFALGYLWTFNVLQRVGMLGSAIGLAVFLLGSGMVRRHPFPFAYLLLTIPVPFFLYQKVSFSLQMLATRLSASLLGLSGVPIAERGNILDIGGKEFFVAEACSGIRSLLAILSVAILFAYVFRSGLLPGVILVLTAVPVTILVNVLRIFLTGWIWHRFGTDLTQGAIHDSMGMILFCVSLVFLYVDWLFIKWLFRIDPAKKQLREGP
jgi:exosortase